PPLQLADDHVVAFDRECGREHEPVVHDAQELAVEPEMHDAIVQPVRRDDPRRLEARIDGDLMQDVELVRRRLPSEGLEVVAGGIEPVDVVARVAVSDVEVAFGATSIPDSSTPSSSENRFSTQYRRGIASRGTSSTTSPANVIFTNFCPRRITPEMCSPSPASRIT